ncbi:hypothetical protein JL720_3509 [Aureococcus anophagefferens]|nr:hypothetical protein JL720_3509 [Aureococcus anophagefferens]
MRGLAAAVVWVVALRPAAPSPTDAIGRDVGMDRSQRVPEHEGARIMRDAEDGRPEHLYFAALLYLYGKGGVAESPAEAEGAQRRHGGSMYYIGLMTLYGHGVPVDYDVARYWFQRAESANDAAFGDLASNARRELEASLQMAETFIAEAEANWTSANEPPGAKYNTA